MVVDVYHQITPEFLNTLTILGLPNHNIKLKIGVSIMLLRNLDQDEGLYNGSRLVVSRLANHVIGSKIITRNRKGQYIPRMFVTIIIPMGFKAY